MIRKKPTIKKKKRKFQSIQFQNTDANCNEDTTELIIICSRSKDRSNIRQWRPTPGGQTSKA